MPTSPCQKMTASLQRLLTLKSNFEHEHELQKLGLDKQLEWQGKVVDEMNAALNEYQEFRWPPEDYPRIELEIGGKTAKELVDELHRQNIEITEQAMNMILGNEREFSVSKRKVTAICLSVRQLGFISSDPTVTKTVFAEAKRNALELCPFELGIYQRLNNINPGGDDGTYSIAMKPAHNGAFGNYIFRLDNRPASIGIGYCNAGPNAMWDLQDEFMFCMKRFQKITRKSN